MNNNPLFSKESLESAASFTGETKFKLLYRSNKLPAQIKAGNELRLATFVLATIIDHIFDYRPYSWFMNNEESNDIYPQYINWFKSHLDAGIDNAINYVNNDFAVLDTITRDENYSFQVLPQREYDKEEHVKAVFAEINKNREEIKHLLNVPKKVSDPSKPTRDELLQLIKLTKETIDSAWETYNFAKGFISQSEVMGCVRFYEMALNSLYMAWEVYNFGHHSDFWKEGDSMIGYMMFQANVKRNVIESIDTLQKVLEEQTTYEPIERDVIVTKGLLKVFNHLIDNNLID